MPSSATCDTEFPHAFESAILRELPNRDLPRYYYPGASSHGGSDGLIVEVTPESGASWLGIFAFGDIARDGATGIFSMPDPTKLLVVAQGQGFVVTVDTPTAWELARAMPVMDVRPIPSKRLLVLAEYTTLAAYGDTGLRWVTRRLSWDGLEITAITDSAIEGSFWDVRTGTVQKFAVDLSTGAHRGGADLALR